MGRTLGRLAVALAVPLALAVAPAAHAADACVETDTFNYSPPLGLQSTTGSMSGTHSNLCARTDLTFYTSNGTIGASYTGNCLVAFFGANTASVVVLGGTVHAMVDLANGRAKVLVMRPNGICPTSSATGSGVWLDW
jgi:hypothetical protein